ncbi:hypothetical protein GCM10017771_91520 [Streptomyces capitiformicae]|uniref:Uncharacterized protein n=1 Tax=Streptomyces capitiformicae TaxID=2014920 RepID=A0A918ZRZ3_9ACTN|nr:hypothetical protein GCM10017771_91520 [Streptomyces capitiformicae]
MLRLPEARRCSSSARLTTNTTRETSQNSRYSATWPTASRKRKSCAVVTKLLKPVKVPPASVNAK